MMKWVIILMLVGCTSKKVTTDNTKSVTPVVQKIKPAAPITKFDSLKLINTHKQ